MIFNPSEQWPTNGDGTFDLPPLESAANPTVIKWRGVRFADVAKELYYEHDGLDFSRDFQDDDVCANTGEPPDLNPSTIQWLRKHTPEEVTWENMTSMSVLYYFMASYALSEAIGAVGEGLTNSVPIESAFYDNFHLPDDSDYNIFKEATAGNEQADEGGVDTSMKTLTLAVSYAHKNFNTEGLLKANQYQIAQLEAILCAIRKNPPANTEYIRLWTDNSHAKQLARSKKKEHSKWIFHGLLPYAVFPVIWLSSGDETDKISMWCICEQILADGALGCLFSIEQPHKPCFPLIGKQIYSNQLPAKAIKTVGDGLSINRSLSKLAAAIHSGVLDDTATYHIADAQELIRLSYYMTRFGDVSMAHAVNCEKCLHATFREHHGFITALHECCDLYREDGDKHLQLRVNRTRTPFSYPRVRARRGYVDWHGVREFAPGAGRFAKFLPPVFVQKFKKNIHIVTVDHDGLPSSEYCVLVSAYPCSDGPIRYMVLLVHGRNLFSSDCSVLYSVRLNVKDLTALHGGVQERDLNGKVFEMFWHPQMDKVLVHLEFRGFADVSSVTWGVWGLKSSTENEEG